MAGQHMSGLLFILLAFHLLVYPAIVRTLPAPTPEPTPAGSPWSTDYRANIDLPAVWSKADGKAKYGEVVGWTFDRNKDSSWTTDLLYGCTVVVLADAKYVIFGHFTDPHKTNQCIDMSDEHTAEQNIIDGLSKALNDVNFNPSSDEGENAHAWIFSTYKGNPEGLSSISSEIGVKANIHEENITDHRYTGSGFMDTSSDGPRGKVVVTWSQSTAHPGGGTLATLIEDNHVGWTADYDCSGNQVLFPDAAVSSCSLPPSKTSSSTFPPPTTDSLNCQICTQDSPSHTSCASMASCTPSKPKALVQIGSSPVFAGTLTGAALSTSVSSALAKICPTPSKTGAFAECSTDTVKVGNYDYVEKDNLQHDGHLKIKIGSSSYNDTKLLKAMIDSAAMTAMHASANQKNCYNTTYSVQNSKRDLGLSSIAERFFGINSRQIFGEGTHQEEKRFCNIGHFAGVQYFNQWWRIQPDPGAVSWLDAEWEFEKGKQGGSFICDFIGDLIDALAVLEPEFLPEGMTEADAFKAACEGDFGKLTGLAQIGGI